VPACPACDATNPEGNRFCGSCGTALGASACASCGAPNPDGQRFCGRCGTALADGSAPEADAPVEERKLATVLFADVVGFTSLAERTDAEVVARMVDSAFRDLGAVVADHGGAIDKYMGDSVMAVFGVPVAHDDDAERAVAAGLAMRQLGGDLVFSIGINSGEVMVSAVGRGDMTAIGDTVNVAARLEKAAAPGEVLCGRLTAELARARVEFKERQPVLLKGKRQPVEVFEALRLQRPGDSASSERNALVGRDEELSFLLGQWRRVRDDRQAKLMVLCGEAGSGKTRLLEELADTIGGDEGDALVVRAAYPSYGVMGGMRLAAELIDQVGSSSDAEVEARVRSMTGEIDPSLRAIDGVGIRHEQLWALGRLLKEKAAGRPLVIMIDDMHGGDEGTLELLGEIAVRLREVPVLTVVAGRTDPGTWLGRFAAATTVRLSPLARVHAGDLAEMFVGDKPLADEARDFLVDLTNGNPLYLRELVAMARARNMLIDDGDCYRVTAHAGIPATLQALLAARLDALDRGQKLALQHVAVLGEATEQELTALGGLDMAPLLGALADAGIVRQGLDGRYETADPLLREVAYDMLSRHARGDLHRRAAAVVERPEERVRHLERATDYLGGDEELSAEAAEALAGEGQALLESSRHADAVPVLAKAVALGVRRPGLLLELARAQTMCGMEHDALATLELIADDPENPALAAERDHTAANVKTFTDPAWALPRLREAAERWNKLGNKEKEAWAYANAGVGHFYLSQMEESAASLEQAMDIFESLGDRSGVVASSSFLCLARPGDPRVNKWSTEALQFADDTGDRTRQMAALATLSWQHFFRSFAGSPSESAEAESFARRLAELAAELGAGDMAVHGWSLLAVMARLSGRLEEASAHVAALQRVIGRTRPAEPWLAWAASFAVAVASGAPGAAPPYPPDDALDPVILMAGLVIHVELILAGRAEEALRRFERAGPPALRGPMADVGGLVYAAALVLGGRGLEAPAWTDRARHGALMLEGRSAAATADALDAEVSGDVSGLGPVPVARDSLAGAMTLRAYAATGDVEALEALRRAAKDLAMPGLLAGLS